MYMPSIHKEAIVPFSPSEMYQLVNAVEAYPEFLPWCRACEILEQGENWMEAKVVVAKGGIQHSFTTLNQLVPNALIEMRQVQGPFAYLQGFWKFESLDKKSTKIIFDLEFKLASYWLDLTFGPIFQQLTRSFVNAFVERAQRVYGLD